LDRSGRISKELKQVNDKLSSHYEALESKQFAYEDLAPRIRELRSRQEDLSKAKVLADAEAAAQGVPLLDHEKVKAYVAELRELISVSELPERKSFLRSFIKKIVVDKGQSNDSLYNANGQRWGQDRG